MPSVTPKCQNWFRRGESRDCFVLYLKFKKVCRQNPVCTTDKKIVSTISGQTESKTTIDTQFETMCSMKLLTKAESKRQSAPVEILDKAKTLNPEKSTMLEVLKNEELNTIIHCISAGIGDDFDLKKIKYDKVIIMSDADKVNVRLSINWQ